MDVLYFSHTDNFRFERTLCMKRVLVVQHAWEDPPGTLGEMMQEQGILFDTVKVEEGDILPTLTGYDAFVILGGPQHAADDHVHLYLAQENDLIRQAVAQDIPLLGVCLTTTGTHYGCATTKRCND